MSDISQKLRDVVRVCINAEASRRPDINYVYGVAREMHSRTQATGSAVSMAHDHQNTMYRHRD
jgi:hypothetical protein